MESMSGIWIEKTSLPLRSQSVKTEKGADFWVVCRSSAAASFIG
jgi:hypothetical protein